MLVTSPNARARRTRCSTSRQGAAPGRQGRASGFDHPHMAATTMLAAGISAKAVAIRLGHSSPAFTLERYVHAVPALDEDAADRLQDVIRNARQQDGSQAISGQVRE